MRQNGFVTGVMYILLVFLAVGLAILIFFNYQANTQQMEAIEAEEIAASITPTPEPTATPEPTPTPARTAETVTLVFAGDLVGQAGLTTDAAGSEGGSYDFYNELDGVLPSLAGSDFSACTMVGTVAENEPYGDYRMPATIATALAGAGFQLVNAATDHTLDQGVDGLRETVDVMQNEGLYVAGAYSGEQSHYAFMADVHGINVAILSYTYSTGAQGKEVSVEETPWCLDIFTRDYMQSKETVDYDRIDQDIATVREAGADIVVCFLYWWDNTQYYPAPRQSQIDVADRLCRDGVDIIIGGGVKTPQPIETKVVERADGTKANCVVCYSLSNLMSCFTDPNTNLSAAARISVSRDTGTGETWVSGVSYRPLFMLNTGMYADYTEPGWRYRLLDAYNVLAERDSSVVSDLAFNAISSGVKELQNLLGAEYDIANNGVTMDYPY